MARGYGQYCPLALAVELLGRRWTLLVISRILDGCHRFNEIHRGVHRMSPTLLSRRLGELEEAGILESRPTENGRGRSWSLTPAGQELEALIEGLAVWGQRWARDMELDDLDPAFLVWSIHTRLDTDAMPEGRTVVEFTFTGAPKDCRRFWLVQDDGHVDMCLDDPGHDVDLAVRADLRRFVEAWRGFRDLGREIAAGRIRLDGSPALARRFPEWLKLSMLAPFPRMRPGRERRTSRRTAAGSNPG